MHVYVFREQVASLIDDGDAPSVGNGVAIQEDFPATGVCFVADVVACGGVVSFSIVPSEADSCTGEGLSSGIVYHTKDLCQAAVDIGLHDFTAKGHSDWRSRRGW